MHLEILRSWVNPNPTQHFVFHHISEIYFGQFQKNILGVHQAAAGGVGIWGGCQPLAGRVIGRETQKADAPGQQSAVSTHQRSLHYICSVAILPTMQKKTVNYFTFQVCLNAPFGITYLIWWICEDWRCIWYFAVGVWYRSTSIVKGLVERNCVRARFPRNPKRKILGWPDASPRPHTIHSQALRLASLGQFQNLRNKTRRKEKTVPCSLQCRGYQYTAQ